MRKTNGWDESCRPRALEGGGDTGRGADWKRRRMLGDKLLSHERGTWKLAQQGKKKRGRKERIGHSEGLKQREYSIASGCKAGTF